MQAFFGGAMTGVLATASILIIYLNWLNQKKAVSTRINQKHIEAMRAEPPPPVAVTRILVKEREIRIS